MIEQGQVDPENVFKLIEAEAALWVRIAATRDGDSWHETLLEVTSGVAPPRWIVQHWEYDEAIFLSVETDGATVAGWLRSHMATIGGVSIVLPAVQGGQRLQWWTYSSGATTASYESLLWPFTSYQLAPQPLKNGPGSGSLIGNGPSFVRFAQAAAAFFSFPLGLGGSVDHIAPAFRQQDLSARISKVLVGAASIDIRLEGKALDGMTVELAGDNPGPSDVLSGQGEETVSFPLPSGLTSGTWIVLKRGTKWFDRKFINYPHTLSPDPGVEIVVEPVTQLEAIVSGGEGPTVEFKSVIPEPNSKLREKVCQTVAAFANGDGGQLLFGVEDDGNIVGLSAGAEERQSRDTVTQFLTSTVTPLPTFSFESIQIEGDDTRVVLVVIVEAGAEPPYGVKPDHPRYYIRRGATTFEASADQVRALARSRPTLDSGSGSALGLQNLLK